MQNITCPECSRRFSDEYKSCPHCGKNFGVLEGEEAEIEAELEEATKLCENYKFDEAYIIVRRLAQKGSAKAQHRLGSFYEHPTDGHCQSDKAEYWYKKSAEQGYTPAMHSLAVFYYYTNPQQSEYWYRKAADQGNNRALYELGMEYEYGGRFAKDLQRAAGCYRELLERDSFSFSDATTRLERINAELSKK